MAVSEQTRRPAGEQRRHLVLTRRCSRSAGSRPTSSAGRSTLLAGVPAEPVVDHA
jgi:hypothetical protein